MPIVSPCRTKSAGCCRPPFGTYQGDSKQALHTAIRIMKESSADAVKLEGGKEVIESVNRILSAGIPVMGHLGLCRNQSINTALMPYVQGKLRGG